ncbi:MAG: hypothetical protein HQL62_06495 [Magnetococcales bacterium]|nr:hypothetical protein [Magnetococcales bacterium]
MSICENRYSIWLSFLVLLLVLTSASTYFIYVAKRDTLSFHVKDYLINVYRLTGPETARLRVNSLGNSMMGFVAIDANPTVQDRYMIHISPIEHLLALVFRWWGNLGSVFIFYYLMAVCVVLFGSFVILRLTGNRITSGIFFLSGIWLPSFMPSVLADLRTYSGWGGMVLIFVFLFAWKPDLFLLWVVSACGIAWREDFTIIMLLAACLLVIRNRAFAALALGLPSVLYLIFVLHHNMSIHMATFAIPSRVVFIVSLVLGLLLLGWMSRRGRMEWIRHWDRDHPGVLYLIFFIPFFLVFLQGIPGEMVDGKGLLSNMVRMVKYTLRSPFNSDRFYPLTVGCLFILMTFFPGFVYQDRDGALNRSQRRFMGVLLLFVVWSVVDRTNDLRAWSARDGLREHMVSLLPRLNGLSSLTALDYRTYQVLHPLDGIFVWEHLSVDMAPEESLRYPASLPVLKNILATKTGQYVMTTPSFQTLLSALEGTGLAEQIELCEQNATWTVARNRHLGRCP